MSTGRQKRESTRIVAEVMKLTDDLNDEAAGKVRYIVTDKIDATINNVSITAIRGDRLMLTPDQAKVLRYSVLELNKDER